MNLNLVASVSLIALTIGLLVVLWYLISILANIRRILKPIDRMTTELEKEFKPLLNDMSGITSSLRNFLSRFDRITGLIFGKADLMAQGAEKVSSYLQKFISNPKVEIESIGAGIKKAFDVLLGRKENKDGQV
ncbi:MAG: hypothetical protein WC527_04580 [Candidatus Margulisiibacteriota bacterium]